MADRWLEIKATGPQDNKDLAALLLIEAGSPGVMEQDDSTIAGRLVSFSKWEEEDTSGPFDIAPEAVFKAYLPVGSEEQVARLKRDLLKLGWSIGAAPFKDRDWEVKWKTGLRPVRVGFGGVSVLVRPSWSKAARRPGEKVIEIDPGMAFGTGGHETTKMCLRAMLRLLTDRKLKGLRSGFLDVGTGTGVLAIAAKKLGVRKAVGTEIDRVALKVARKNARANRVKITLSGLAPSRVRGRFPMVAANILAGELTVLAPELCGKLKDGGFLILSGILVEESAAVEETYRAAGLKLYKKYTSGEWAALVFEKPAAKG
ncbi:MAG: 50S ribosomal protein L11 methyltransferase [Thermodesulfobacteriota bacterium]